MKKGCARPCNDCPWLGANQTKDAIAASPIDGRGIHWFEKANLLRHWIAAAKVGAMLPCHVTDNQAPLYGGKPTAAREGHICVGQSILAFREITAFMNAGQDFNRYRKMPGKRFSAVGLAAWAARLFYAGATFHLGGRTFTMPKIEADDPRVRVPWKDMVHDR